MTGFLFFCFLYVTLREKTCVIDIDPQGNHRSLHSPLQFEVLNVGDEVVVDVLATGYDAGVARPPEVTEHDRVAARVGVHVVPDGGAGRPEAARHRLLVEDDGREAVLDGVLGGDYAGRSGAQNGHTLLVARRLHTQFY